MERDGYLDPHTATHALAAAAREHGADIRTHVRVDAVERAPSGEIAAVHTTAGRIECEHLVVAAGIWAPRVAAMAGVWIPSVPVDHQHIALTAVPGHEWARDAPCFRDTDNLVYGKAESGGVLFGGYEPDPPARWLDGAPWEHGGRALPPDHERFALLMDGACRRFPALREAGVAALVCHPDAMTPDGNPLVGPVPGVPGLWMACGLSLNGFGGAGGIGRELTRLIVEGESELDLSSYRPWRFGRVHRDPLAASAAAREAYRYYYRLRYPADQDTMGRPRRLSPLHLRQAERGALFAAKHGWERPDHLRPGEPSRRAGEEQRAFGFAEPPWHARVGEEHRAIRERAGLIDMTSFGKLAVEGPGALALLEHVCAARIDRPAGSVVYTQMLDADGGIVGDVTVTRLDGERFRMVTGAGAVDHDLGWLRLHEHGAGGAPVELRDESDEWAVIGLWGPRSRDVLARAGAEGVDAESLPFRRARELALGGATVLAQRITYVGELGFELYVPPAWAVEVWDRLAAAGEQDGLDVVRLSRARRPAAREGLPLPRHRPDRLGHTRRGGPRHARRGRQGRLRRTRRHARPARRRPARAASPHAARGRRPCRGLRGRGGAARRRGRRAPALDRVRLQRRAHGRDRVPAGGRRRGRAAGGRGARRRGRRRGRAGLSVGPVGRPRARLIAAVSTLCVVVCAGRSSRSGKSACIRPRDVSVSDPMMTLMTSTCPTGSAFAPAGLRLLGAAARGHRAAC